jgi:hypothetical protein
MAWRALLIAVAAAVAGCSGQQAGDVEGNCTRAALAVDGGGDATMGWLCTASKADASRGLASCSTEPVVGRSCVEQETVDTTNPAAPSHYTVYPECFGCTAAGTGTDWTCGTSGWQPGATFSCSP